MFIHKREIRVEGTKGRIPDGVAIMLSLLVVEAWMEAESKPPITTLLESKCIGRFTGVKIRFPKINSFENTIRGFIKLFFASIYHLVEKS